MAPRRDPTFGQWTAPFVMGPVNTKVVQTPGNEWPDPDADHIRGLAARLVAAYDALRRWNFKIPPTRAYRPPQFR